jgi:limonene-1,2-epoxide hydrolase
VTAASINLAFRLLEAKELKAALASSPGVLAIIASSWFYEEVVRHSTANVDEYRRVRVTVKGLFEVTKQNVSFWRFCLFMIK